MMRSAVLTVVRTAKMTGNWALKERAVAAGPQGGKVAESQGHRGTGQGRVCLWACVVVPVVVAIAAYVVGVRLFSRPRAPRGAPPPAPPPRAPEQ